MLNLLDDVVLAVWKVVSWLWSGAVAEKPMAGVLKPPVAEQLPREPAPRYDE